MAERVCLNGLEGDGHLLGIRDGAPGIEPSQPEREAGRASMQLAIRDRRGHSATTPLWQTEDDGKNAC